jgi:hypothetical protein
MKIRVGLFLLAVFVGATRWVDAVAAQVDVSATLARYDYLQYEPLLMEVTITNRSARKVRLENRDDKPWLQLMVTKASGEIVQPRQPMDTSPLEIEAGKSVARTVNLSEMFFLAENSRYAVFVKLVEPSGQEKRIGNGKFFVGKGVTVWEQTTGVLIPAGEKAGREKPEPSKAETKPAIEERPKYGFVRQHGVLQQSPKLEDPPVDLKERSKFEFVRNHGVLNNPDEKQVDAKEETRHYALIRFATQGDNNFLYVRITDPDQGIVYGCYPLGKGLPFYKPQSQLDKDGVLHVLFQKGSRLFDYYRISPNAKVLERAEVTNMTSPPTLERSDDGLVFLRGGERRGEQ